ncbi:helix-turn-helix DNA binding domain protein [Arthrobacter phage Gusanita]|nr:helix-turn-helix DNA binding domain protein [Arthrobacter phage Gusanita]
MSIQPLHSRVPEFQLKDRLRLAREQKNLEQADIAAELGISRATVSNYERGVTVPGKLVINAWAVICDVDVEWLKTGKTHDMHPGGPEGGERAPKSKAVSNHEPLDYKVAGSAAPNVIIPLRPWKLDEELPLETAA